MISLAIGLSAFLLARGLLRGDATTAEGGAGLPASDELTNQYQRWR